MAENCKAALQRRYTGLISLILHCLCLIARMKVFYCHVVLYMMQQYICVSIYDATVHNISH